MDLRIEERRVANEAIATLVNIKSTMADMLLKPAGVPESLFQPIFKQRDQIRTNRSQKGKLRHSYWML